MKKIFLTALATGLLVAGMGGVAQADLYNFHLIGDDNVPESDLGSQLQVEVTDGATFVSFEFMNIGGIASVITELYFDVVPDNFLDFSSYTLTSTGEVAFSEDANPQNLPGGNTIQFASDWDADANNPAPKWGINNSSTEALTITFAYQADQTFSDIINAISLEKLRMGLHVTGIYPTDDSEAYVNDPGAPVPEPATMLLFGAGLAGLAGVARRKKKA